MLSVGFVKSGGTVRGLGLASFVSEKRMISSTARVATASVRIGAAASGRATRRSVTMPAAAPAATAAARATSIGT